ncbi:hypothetical protein I3842_01G039500 [Carya illinoinensis]|uniref:Protein kinase domain-containing protein n=1 Tax=Carya illinoinensis TaxID=32201 RepID=A0A922K5K8_CARIL|nr:hypothetical protein I3842_01G039500 [Carya illinoinensis]
MLEVLGLQDNSLTSPLPSVILNISSLNFFAISSNHILGALPNDLCSHCPNFRGLYFYLQKLETLALGGNNFIGIIPGLLPYIVLRGNKLIGHISSYLSNCSKLIIMEFSQNLFSRPIPKSLGNLKYLQRPLLSGNQLMGEEAKDHKEPNFISSLSNCRSLRVLKVGYTPLDITIPNSIQNFPTSFEIFLANNCQIRGHIPMGMGFLKGMIWLHLGGNNLIGNITFTFGGLERLQRVYLYDNRIEGLIPEEICQLRNLGELDLSNNRISGVIPNCISNLSLLQSLYLSSNRLESSIPLNIWGLKNLLFLDLSSNSLGGHLSSNMTKLDTLEGLDLSRNEITGEIPSIIGMKDILLKCILLVIASVIIFVMLVYSLRSHRKSNMEIPTSFNALHALEHRMISYQDLCQGTNNFCESNLLGVGGFGCDVPNSHIRARGNRGIGIMTTRVKHLIAKCQVFNAECKVLCTIRHRNLVKIITTCTNLEFRALSYNYCLDLLQRINIMVDVASALDYLHHGQLESILHFAHVDDFGIAKILVENKDVTHTKTLGPVGYIAPEYGFEGKVSIKTDVYNYDITLLEMITRKKPTNDMFVGGFTLRQLVNASILDRMMEIVDGGLLRIEDGRDTIALQSILLSIMDLGLRCSEELPDTRMDIKDVLVKLNKIK